MKYRFRPTDRDISSPRRAVSYKLKGRRTLRRISAEEFYPLRDPEPFLCPLKARKRRSFYSYWKTIRLRVRGFLLRNARKRRGDAPHKSLPVLSGALCGSLSVTLLVAILGLYWLSIPYGEKTWEVTVPDLRGRNPFEALGENESFNLILKEEVNPNVADGLVISQSPSPGAVRRISKSEPYCNIYLTVSRSEEPYRLEELIGFSLREATLTLQNKGLTVRLSEEYSSRESGTVLGTIPAAGTSLSRGEEVTLRISLGQKPARAYVPELAGLSESEAVAKLQSAGLSVGQVYYQTASAPAGTVIGQDAAPHTVLKAYSEVGFTVSLGERYILRTVPDLYGRSLEDAVAILRSYGLTVLKRISIDNPAPKGTVISQFPLAGTPITAETVGVELSVSAHSDE